VFGWSGRRAWPRVERVHVPNGGQNGPDRHQAQAVSEGPATRKPAAAATRPTSAIDRTTKLSEEVLDSVDKGQRAAIDAVRKFVDTVDQALPAHGEGPSKRQEIVDSAMEMADRLVHTQYDFIRKVIDSAGKSLRSADGEK
jgi:hypothetical protein